MVTINIKLNNHPFNDIENISIADVNLNQNFKYLKEKMVTSNQKEIGNFNFIFHGSVLKDEDIMYNVGFRAGSTVYGFVKHEKHIPKAVPLSLVEDQQLLVSLRATVANPNFRNFIQKLRTPAQIERLVTECPALKGDPTSLAFVLDPDLIISLQNPDVLSQTIEKHPVRGRVLQSICNLIGSETTPQRSTRQVSYSLDALSDEEMDVDNGDSDTRNGARRSSSFQPITPAQLAAALANATGGRSTWTAPSTSSAPRSGLTTPSASSTPFNTPAPPSGSGAGGGASPGGSFITSEMFSQALQNALAASASSASTTLAGASSSNATTIENIGESLQLMREMGIPDEEMSIQALQATNGDVQAAVNLIFAQWMADD